MANVPYVPYPTVPAEGVPGRGPARMDINAPPAAFGALGAQALEKGGAELDQAGQRVFEVAKNFAQMQNVTDALNTSTAASQELGDAETKFRQLSGENATAGFPAFQQQIRGIQDKYAQSLQSPMARMEFLRDFRGMADRSLFTAGLHVGDQAKAAHLAALDGAIKTEQSNIVRYTQTGQEPDFTGLVDKTLMLAHEHGLDVDGARALVQQKAGEAVRDMIVSRMAHGDMEGANKVFTWALDQTSPETPGLPLLDAGHQASISSVLRPYFDQQQANAIVDRAYGSGSDRIADAIHQQESGGQSIPNSWQIQTKRGPRGEPSTWDTYARPGEDINNPTDNEAVGRRIIDDLAQRFGGDPQRVAVGYFSGPGNVAPSGSATPWINDVKDANGKYVSSYVSDVMGRLKPAGDTGYKADALDRAEQMSQNASPEVRNAVHAELMRRLQIQQVQDAALIKRQQALLDNPVSVVASDPQVQQAKAAVKPDDPQTFVTYAHELLGAQTRAGVPDYGQHVLSNEDARGLVHRILAAPADTRAAALTGMAKQYGDVWDRVMGDMVSQKLPALYEILPAIENPAAQVAISSAIGDGKKTLRDAIDPDDAKEIDRAIEGDETLRDLGRSMSYASGGNSKFTDVREALKLGAYSLATTMTPKDAARAMVASITTDKYEFWRNGSGIAKVPRGSLAQVEDFAQEIQSGVSAQDLAWPSYLPVPKDVSSETLDAAKMRAMQGGTWVTNSRDDGLIRLDANGYPVMLSGGQPLTVSFGAAQARPVPAAPRMPALYYGEQ